jgi:hypothetical protein
MTLRRAPQSFALSRIVNSREFCQLVHACHGRFAGKIFANVDRGLPVDRHHRTDRLIFFREKILAIASVSQEHNGTGKKMFSHFAQQFGCAFVPRIAHDHDLSRRTFQKIKCYQHLRQGAWKVR